MNVTWDQLQNLGSKQKFCIHKVCHPRRDLSKVLENKTQTILYFLFNAIDR